MESMKTQDALIEVNTNLEYSLKAALWKYFCEHMILVISGVALTVGGIVLLCYYLQVSHLPDLDVEAIPIILCAAAFAFLLIVFLAAILPIIPGLIWGTSVELKSIDFLLDTDKSPPELNRPLAMLWIMSGFLPWFSLGFVIEGESRGLIAATVFLLMAIVSLFVFFKVAKKQKVSLKFLSFRFWLEYAIVFISGLATLASYAVVALFLKIDLTGYSEFTKHAYGFFIMYMVPVLAIVTNGIAALLAIIARLKNWPFLSYSAPLIVGGAFSGIFLLATQNLFLIPTVVVKSLSIGHMSNVSLVLRQEGCVLLSTNKIPTIEITGTTLCHSDGLFVVSRLGREYLLQQSDKSTFRVVIPKTLVVSWSQYGRKP